jgi:hypothetical protein
MLAFLPAVRERRQLLFGARAASLKARRADLQACRDLSGRMMGLGRAAVEVRR